MDKIKELEKRIEPLEKELNIVNVNYNKDDFFEQMLKADEELMDEMLKIEIEEMHTERISYYLNAGDNLLFALFAFAIPSLYSKNRVNKIVNKIYDLIKLHGFDKVEEALLNKAKEEQ
jgi:hypothetical protein